MKRLTKQDRKIIDNLDPRCEDCKYYRDHNGRMMCYVMIPFLALKETARRRPRGTTMNCGTEGHYFVPNAFHHGSQIRDTVHDVVGKED